MSETFQPGAFAFVTDEDLLRMFQAMSSDYTALAERIGAMERWVTYLEQQRKSQEQQIQALREALHTQKKKVGNKS
jgi:predicted  nucleic acid-binding Zn-ribbon protein